MLDGIHRTGHAVDRFSHAFEQGFQHVERRSLFPEIEFEIGYGKFAGQILEQQNQIGGQGDGQGLVAGCSCFS
jgi:hypothetical protein